MFPSCLSRLMNKTCLVFSIGFCIFLGFGKFLHRKDQNSLLPAGDSDFLGLDADPQGCKPSEKFAFVKTHKTGSTYVQNIIRRYGIDRGLNFVLPRLGHQLSSEDSSDPVRVEWLQEVEWHRDFMESGLYDVYDLHGRIRFRQLLGPQAKSFTILRDPSDAFESGYEFYRVGSVTGLSMEELIEKMESGEIPPTASWKWRNFSFGFSNMMRDFGLPEDEFNSSESRRKVIESMDSYFDLVLLSARMDESLVLLSHLLCLPLARVAMPDRINARKGKNELSEKQREVLRRHQQPDEELFAHFVDEFERRVREFGFERMEKSVAELNKLRQSVGEACSVVKDTEVEALSNNLISSQSIRSNSEECKRMTWSEVTFVHHLRVAQKKRYREIKNND